MELLASNHHPAIVFLTNAPENTTCSVFKSPEPLEKISER